MGKAVAGSMQLWSPAILEAGPSLSKALLEFMVSSGPLVGRLRGRFLFVPLRD